LKRNADARGFSFQSRDVRFVACLIGSGIVERVKSFAHFARNMREHEMTVRWREPKHGYGQDRHNRISLMAFEA